MLIFSFYNTLINDHNGQDIGSQIQSQYYLIQLNLVVDFKYAHVNTPFSIVWAEIRRLEQYTYHCRKLRLTLNPWPKMAKLLRKRTFGSRFPVKLSVPLQLRWVLHSSSWLTRCALSAKTGDEKFHLVARHARNQFGQSQRQLSALRTITRA